MAKKKTIKALMSGAGAFRLRDRNGTYSDGMGSGFECSAETSQTVFERLANVRRDEKEPHPLAKINRISFDRFLLVFDSGVEVQSVQFTVPEAATLFIQTLRGHEKWKNKPSTDTTDADSLRPAKVS